MMDRNRHLAIENEISELINNMVILLTAIGISDITISAKLDTFPTKRKKLYSRIHFLLFDKFLHSYCITFDSIPLLIQHKIDMIMIK